MGNISWRAFNVTTTAGTGKVILSNGGIYEFKETITAAELMLEYPQHVVVEFNFISYNKRPSPLPADNKLDINKLYAMLPVKRGAKLPTFSSEEARTIMLSANGMVSSKNLGFLHLIGKVGGMREKKLEVSGRLKFDLLPESLEERPEFLSRQMSRKGWKPSLDTIREINVNRKVSHWLF